MTGTVATPLARRIPRIAGWFSTYQRGWLRPDLIAGITLAVVGIPKAMAYAAVAGLPVEAGLYTALGAMIAYPFFGTSRPLVVTTTSALGMMTAATIGFVVLKHPWASPSAIASSVAVMAGVILGLAALFRLGFISNFISLPVLIGFEAALGAEILIAQASAILGTHGKSHKPIGILLELPQLLPHTHALTLIISITGVAVMLLLPMVAPKAPASLIWLVLSIVAARLFDLESAGVRLIGNVPSKLPPFTPPDLSLTPLLWPAAMAIALMSFMQSAASAQSFRKPGDGPVLPNRELLAIGASNVAAGFLGGLPAGGASPQTAQAQAAGVRSQLAQWINAAVILLTLLVLAPAISLLPSPALAAVVVVSAAHMLHPHAFAAIGRVRRVELMWAIVTFLGALLIGPLRGLLVAVVISVLSLMIQAARPLVYALAYNRERDIFRRAGEFPDDEILPGLLVLRVEGRLMFVNAANVAGKVQALVEESQPRVIVLDCSAIFDIEYTALMRLTEAEHQLRERGVMLWLSGVNPGVEALLRRAPLMSALGESRVFHDLHDALAAFEPSNQTKG